MNSAHNEEFHTEAKSPYLKDHASPPALKPVSLHSDNIKANDQSRSSNSKEDNDGSPKSPNLSFEISNPVKDNNAPTNSSSKPSMYEAISRYASKQTADPKISFKKNLISSSAQRQSISSSNALPSSQNNIANEPKGTQPVRDTNSSHIASVHSLKDGLEKKEAVESARDSEPSNKAPDSQNLDIILDQAGLEQATMEALKNLSNRLFPSGSYESKGEEQARDAPGSDRLERPAYETNVSTSSELFLNVMTIAAQNERRSLLNRSSGKNESAKIELDENKQAAENSSEEDPIERRAPTPAVTHVKKRNSQGAINENLNNVISQKKDTEDLCNLNDSEVRTIIKEEHHTDEREVQGFAGFVTPSSPQADANQTIQLSNIYALNSTMHNLLGSKGQEESFEKGIAGNLLKLHNSHIQDSHNMSFSIDQPTTTEKDYRERESVPTVSKFEQSPQQMLICSPDGLRRQEVEPDCCDQSAPQDQNQEVRSSRSGGNKGEENTSPENLEGMLTARKCHNQLVDAIKRINVRTFLMLKNIIKPSDNILLCCQAFTKLFAGLSDVIPVSFSIMENIEWNNIKVLFSSPIKILNLISSLPKIIEDSKLSQRNVAAALASLSKIQYDQNETQTDAFYQMYEFVISAIEYYKYFRPEYATPREQSPLKLTESSGLRDSGFPQNLESKKIVVHRIKGPSNQPASKASEKTTSSTGKARTGRSISPINNRLSTQKSSQSNLNKNPIKDQAQAPKTASQKKATNSKSPVPNRVNVEQKASQENQTPIRNLRNAFNDSKVYEEHDTSRDGYEGVTLSFLEDRVNTHEIECEVTKLDDEIERKNKEARDYKAKASRLLIDHERYIKKLQKTKDVIREELERDAELQDRRDLANYLESKEILEKHYIREMIIEEFEVQKELKIIELKARKEEHEDDLLESLKEHCYLTAQKEKTKHEKKKVLWEQYKKISAERLAKRQKEAEESLNQRREIAVRKIEDYVWKKQQTVETKDKLKSEYELLSKMIGDAI